jgi:hypothetical protein
VLSVSAGRTHPAPFEPILARLRAESAVHFGASGVRLVPLEYQERPYSYLLRVQVSRDGGAVAAGHVFVKVFKAEPIETEISRMRLRVTRDFETSRRIYTSMSHLPDLGAVRPIVCYPEYLATVTEETSGDNLLDYLRTHATWFPARQSIDRIRDTMARVGRWIGAFQAIEEATGHISIEGLRTYVDVRLKRLAGRVPAVVTEADRRRVLAHIDSLGSEVSAADLREVPIHADLAPANVLISGERVVVLDFAMANRGSVFHDITRLFVQLDLLALKPQFRSAVVRSLEEALLHGFDETLSPGRPLFRLLLLLHRVNHFGTLSLRHERFPASVYNSRVRRSHWNWIEAELRSSGRAGAAG